MKSGSRIFIAGGSGLLGSALTRRLGGKTFSLCAPARKDLNLHSRHSVKMFFERTKPEYVFLAAAKVGGITDNIKHPVDFLEENLLIQQNVMRAAHEAKVKKLLFFGSNCCYPKFCNQPIKEEYLMTGLLEETNQAYAVAKLTGIEMCRSFNAQFGTNFIVAIPASIYGENDHFDSERSHVMASLITKFHKAKIMGSTEVVLMGDGSPLREFIYCDDAADAAVFLMENFNANSGETCINVGTGAEYSIRELANVLKSVVGYEGEIVWDTSKPNGMARKLLDSSRCRSLGWKHKVGLEEGIRRAYRWYLENYKTAQTN